MKISREQCAELTAKLAEELIGDYMEKTAGTTTEDLKNFAKGDRDFSDPKDQKTKFWKDRVGGGLPVMATGIPVSMLQELNRKKIHSNALAAPLGFAGLGGALYINDTRGRALAAKNGVKWEGKNTASSSLIPFVTPDSIVKKKVRERAAAKEAAEALIEAVLTKQAAMDDAFEADMYVEASERALNSLGYSMFAEEE